MKVSKFPKIGFVYIFGEKGNACNTVCLCLISSNQCVWVRNTEYTVETMFTRKLKYYVITAFTKTLSM